MQAYLDQEMVIKEKESRNKDPKCFSKFAKATLNSHCLLDVDPGKFNLDMKIH